MNISFITIGRSFPREEKAWIDTYLQRLKACATIQHHHHKDKFDLYKDRNDPKYEKWIESILPTSCFLIILDENGKQFNTQKLYEKIFNIELNHQHICFVVGGAYGLPACAIEKANLVLSLSKFTLPHKLAFLVLVEQVYRCFTIQQKIPYHHI